MTTQYITITTKKDYRELVKEVSRILNQLVYNDNLETLEIHKSKINTKHIRIKTLWQHWH